SRQVREDAIDELRLVLVDGPDPRSKRPDWRQCARKGDLGHAVDPPIRWDGRPHACRTKPEAVILGREVVLAVLVDVPNLGHQPCVWAAPVGQAMLAREIGPRPLQPAAGGPGNGMGHGVSELRRGTYSPRPDPPIT